MVLRPRQQKTVNISFGSASFLLASAPRVTSPSTLEPLNFKEVDQYLCWHTAIKSEIVALYANATWSLVSFDPSMNIVGCRWVYKIKHQADGAIDHYKACLVAWGFTQQEDIDYSKTFSSIVKPTTVRLVLTIAVSKGWQMRQLDVHNAFFNGSLWEVVYMEQPSGFVDSALPTHVCRFHKSLYGLKQTPRAWYTWLSDFLLTIGFRASKVDTFLFILNAYHDICYLLVYVDDILLIDNNFKLIQHLITLLSLEFKLHDLGNAHYFLRIEVAPTSMGLVLSHHKYALDILSRTSMSSCKPVDTPASVLKIDLQSS
jgi:histone deacetylase 1/2